MSKAPDWPEVLIREATAAEVDGVPVDGLHAARGVSRVSGKEIAAIITATPEWVADPRLEWPPPVENFREPIEKLAQEEGLL